MAQPQPGPTQDPLRALEEKITELLGGLREKTSQAQEQTLRHLELYSEGLDELKSSVEQALHSQALLVESARTAVAGLSELDSMACQLSGLKTGTAQLEAAVQQLLQ